MSPKNLSALIAGVLFAFGLGLAGMTDPKNVLGFLDVVGDWNPALAFVMMGALSVHFVFVRVAKRLGTPLLETRFAWPTRADVDARLLIGAVLFGIGWGASGYCPGPAVVSLVTLSPALLVFISFMLLAMIAEDRLRKPAVQAADAESL